MPAFRSVARIVIVVGLAALPVALAPAAQAAPGALDPTFGSGGTVTTPIGLGASINGVAVQPDGKIVAAGFSFNGSNDDFALARYTAAGALDPTFGSGGTVITSIGSSHDYASGVALQPDGKIVVAGYGYTNLSYTDFALARYTTSGVLDTTFDTDGKVTTGIGTGNDIALGVAVQPDGKIVVAGYSVAAGSFEGDFALTRYTATGALDTTFDTDGKVTTNIDFSHDVATGLALQPDGKIVVAGRAFTNPNNDFAVVRYTTSGALDATFSTDGKVTTAVGPGDDHGNAVAVQPDGKIVVAGYSSEGGYAAFALVRYTTTGAPDTTFDVDGKVTTSIRPSGDFAQAVAVQPDGKIVAAGYSYGPTTDFALARYTTSGALDTTFDTDGTVTTDIGAGEDVAKSLAIQPDGKMVAAGDSDTGSTDAFALARYEGDASVWDVTVDPEATLGPTGRITVTGGIRCGIVGDTYKMYVRVDQTSTGALTRIGLATGTCSGDASNQWTITPRKKTGSPPFAPGTAQVCWLARTLQGTTETDRVSDCTSVTLVGG